MKKPPHPPDETVVELRDALRRNHPELSDEQIDRILGGEPKRRRHGYQVTHRWTVGKRGAGAGIVATRARRRGRKTEF